MNIGYRLISISFLTVRLFVTNNFLWNIDVRELVAGYSVNEIKLWMLSLQLALTKCWTFNVWYSFVDFIVWNIEHIQVDLFDNGLWTYVQA